MFALFGIAVLAGLAFTAYKVYLAKDWKIKITIKNTESDDRKEFRFPNN